MLLAPVSKFVSDHAGAVYRARLHYSRLLSKTSVPGIGHSLQDITSMRKLPHGHTCSVLPLDVVPFALAFTSDQIRVHRPASHSISLNKYSLRAVKVVFV